MSPATRRLAAVVLLAVLAVLPTGRAFADDPVVHTVQPGENLFRIGLKYGVPWTAISQANGLTSTFIYVGQQLVIPGASGASPSAPPAPAPATAAPASGTYTVARGDTLFGIAARFGTTAYELASANGLWNWNLIYAGQRLAIPGGAVAASPAPAPTSAAKRIVVDISEQRLYAYENGALVYNFVASTGMPGLDTWPGTYSVLTKIPNAYGGNWNIWMPNWLGIYWAGSLQNGIHALPILPGGARLWDGYLGTRISYGCVVLGVNEAQLLYDWAEIGTPVIIQY